MVNSHKLDAVFAALADPTRRAMLTRLRSGSRTLGELAEPFDMSAVAVWKHVGVLARAGLVVSRREGRVAHCELVPGALQAGAAYFTAYQRFWTDELNQIERHLHVVRDEDKACRKSQTARSRARSASDASSRHLRRRSSKP